MKVSNNALTIFLVLSIIISLTGTLMSTNKMGTLKYTTLTEPVGKASTGTGNITLYVNRTAAIEFKNATIDWGAGYVNTSHVNSPNNCTMNTTGVGTTSTPNCEGAWISTQAGLNLVNVGTLDVNVTLNFSSNESAIGGTVPLFQFNASNDKSLTCLEGSGSMLGPKGAWNSIGIEQVGVFNTTLCDNMSWEDAQDNLAIDFQVRIPSDAPSGTKEVLMIAQATSIE